MKFAISAGVTVGFFVLAGCSSRPGGAVSEELVAAPAAMFDLNDLLHAAAGSNGRPASQLADLEKKRSLFQWDMTRSRRATS